MPIASARIEIESPDPELKFTARVISPPKDGEALVALSATRTGASGTAPVPVTDAIERCGTIPLPPYIRRPDRDPRAGEAPATDDAADRERYQTVFAKESGAAAAPTAGLHFTPGLFDALRARGVSTATLTLHVGLGTFQPVRLEDQDDISRHRIHSELYRIPIETRREIAALRKRGGRLIAIGTTVVRALEHAALWAEPDHETGPAIESSCDLFITPGFRFREVDLLLTNFHLPKSTLLMLVSAFCGRERLLGAYRDAIARGYRLYSYGDAMLISRSNAEPGAERGPGSDSGGSR